MGQSMDPLSCNGNRCSVYDLRFNYNVMQVIFILFGKNSVPGTQFYNRYYPIPKVQL
jgi:hypothetical protein